MLAFVADGRGPVNPLGLQFYNNFINELTRHGDNCFSFIILADVFFLTKVCICNFKICVHIHAGIKPHVTLHHVDLPQALEDEYGGWISRKIVYVL